MAVRNAPVLREEIAVLLAKDAIPPAEMRQGFYSLLLHRTQERWWPSANPGSASLEPGFAQAPVQDADAQAHDQMHSAPGLVCSDRPEGRLLSPFLRFAFDGRAWQYRVLPFGLSLSPRVFTKVVEGALSPLRICYGYLFL